MTNLLGEERSKYKTTISTQRKNHPGLQREKSDVQGMLDAQELADADTRDLFGDTAMDPQFAHPRWAAPRYPNYP